MSDDATQPPSSFYGSLSSSFAKFTHFIDENIRVIQYGVYCTGAVGLVICLHSVRAFTKFNCIQDIPKEFITKHVRLHGQVKWVGVSPPSITAPSYTPPSLPLPENARADERNSDSKIPSSQNSDLTPTKTLKPNEGAANGRHEKPEVLYEDYQECIKKAVDARPWDNNVDPEVARIEYDEELHPVYLQVDHIPVFPFSRKKSTILLPLQLADVEVSKHGFNLIKQELINQRAWFTLVSHDKENDHLNAWIKPAKMFHRSINERILRAGFAMMAPLDLNLHDDRQYVKQYMKLMKAQEYAEKKKVGLWKPAPQPSSASKKIFKRIVTKLRALLGRTQ